MFDRVTHTQLSTGTNEKASYIPAGMFGVSDYNYVGISHVDDDPGISTTWAATPMPLTMNTCQSATPFARASEMPSPP